jgi:DNA-binding CsgD family transcriptional regulator
MTPRKVTPAVRERIAQMQEDGLTQEAIARALGISQSYVSTLVGTKGDRRPVTAAERKAIREAIESGLSVTETAARLGRARKVVQRYSRGIPRAGDPRRLTPEQIAEARRLWVLGVPTAEIAGRVGCGEKGVRSNCRDLERPDVSPREARLVAAYRAGVRGEQLARRFGYGGGHAARQAVRRVMNRVEAAHV